MREAFLQMQEKQVIFLGKLFSQLGVKRYICTIKCRKVWC